VALFPSIIQYNIWLVLVYFRFDSNECSLWFLNYGILEWILMNYKELINKWIICKLFHKKKHLSKTMRPKNE